MDVLLKVLIETLVITLFLWIGKSVMKAEVPFKSLAITALAGSLASQVPFLGTYLSFAVVLFFLWKMARVDVVPDGVLILIIGKGAGLIMMVYVVALMMDHVETDKLDSFSNIPIYVDEEGTRYFATGEEVFYVDENNQKVFVDADVILGISEIMEVAEGEKTSSDSSEDSSLTEGGELQQSEDLVANEASEIESSSQIGEFSNPILSDSVIRGEPLPFEVFVPRGWMIGRSEGDLAIRYEDHTYLNCSSRQQGSDNNTYLREEVNRVLSQYSGYEVARQEIITMDGKRWARIQFINDPGDQVLLLTHANQFGCYSIELNGSFRQLSAMKDILNRMMLSFNFPPSTHFVAQLDGVE
ncbi:MAG: hypothetical protein O7C75_13080 [Verrucomicrobia bacterium]|nr:hypothetical protein [Verrucomicrobiota bacterium]